MAFENNKVGGLGGLGGVPMRPPTKLEQWWQSEEGRTYLRMKDKLSRGEISTDDFLLDPRIPIPPEDFSLKDREVPTPDPERFKRERRIIRPQPGPPPPGIY